MLIVDAQVHIWAENTPERPWPLPLKRPHRPVPFSKDDLLLEMQAAGVHRAVLVPPSWDGLRNDLGLEAARLHPDRFAVMGRLNLDAPTARQQMTMWRQQPGMLGMRYSFLHQVIPMDSWLWPAAEESQIPLMLSSMGAARLPSIGELAVRHPGLKLTIDHLSIKLGTKDEEAFQHLDSLNALAKHPNIAVKATALPHYTRDPYPYRRLHPYIRRVYDAFGPKRMFWGTDLTKLACSYREVVTMFTEEIPWLTTEDKEWIMGRGLCEWIGWKS